MKNYSVILRWGGWLAATSFGFGVAFALVEMACAQSVPTPGLVIVQTDSNQFQIRITNGVSFANYEILRRSPLDTNDFWTWHLGGALGQSNFTVFAGADITAWFQATVGTNWDGDSAANKIDAQPSSTNAGTLSISIDSPLNGSTLN